MSRVNINKLVLLLAWYVLYIFQSIASSLFTASVMSLYISKFKILCSLLIMYYNLSVCSVRQSGLCVVVCAIVLWIDSHTGACNNSNLFSWVVCCFGFFIR